MMCGTLLFVTTFDLAQVMLRQVRVFPNGYGAMNDHAETNVHSATCVTCCLLGAYPIALSRMRSTRQTKLFDNFNSRPTKSVGKVLELEQTVPNGQFSFAAVHKQAWNEWDIRNDRGIYVRQS
jgi:hypothetical protein